MNLRLRSASALLAVGAATALFAQPRTKMLYVTNNTSGTVAAMAVNEAGLPTLIQNTAAGPNPYDLALTSDGKRLVVCNASALTAEPVYTFDVQPSGFLTPTGVPLSIGDGNLSIAMGGNGYALVTQATQDNLLSLDISGATPASIGSAPAGIFPVEVAVSRDGLYAFVSGTSGDGYLNSYRLNANGSITPLQLPGNTTGVGTGQGLATHPTLDVVYQSTGLGNLVIAYRYDSTGALIFSGAVVGGGNSCVEMAVDPSGGYLYVCNVVTDTLTVLPLMANGSPQPSIGSYSIGTDIRDVVCDGRIVYVTDESSGGGSGPGVQAFGITGPGTLSPLGFPRSTGGTRPSHMAVVSPVSVFPPNDFLVTQGIWFGGVTSSLAASDDDRVYVLCDENTPNGAIEFYGQSYVLTPWQSELSVEVSATRDDLSFFFDLYDFAASQWDFIGSVTSSLTDTGFSASGRYFNGKYVEGPTTSAVKARMRMVPTQDIETTDGWLSAVDKVQWTNRT